MERKVSESAIEDHTYLIFPNDLNAVGTVFGGLIMATLDRLTAVVANRHSRCVCVTAAVDAFHFLGPAGHGDVLICKAAVNRAWHTSMEVGAKVLAENLLTGEKRHIVSAYFTYVAIDESHKPTPVPALLPETPLEKRRYEEADIRRHKRRHASEEKKLRRNQNPL